ncbi:MAG: nucleotidyltransferase family protein [Leptolyngbyaceae cyanobacterium bins.59]|nr:nucleotidyltransferase family protein [Leptolyngbyaceae cyanobacterium bins.59]
MQTLSAVTAIILAGGLGTRLRSVVVDRPKVLAEVNGRPFLTYLLHQIAEAGMQRAVFCTGYLQEQVQEAFGSQYAGVQLSYSPELTPLGTGGALRQAMQEVTSETVLVMNGDSFCEANLKDFWEAHQQGYEGHEVGTLMLTHVSNTGRYGAVQVSETGDILSFAEKSNSQEPGWINAGIYLLPRRWLLSLPEDKPISLEREVFPTWIGHGLRGYQNQGRFIDIGTPESYAAAQLFFKN